LPAHHTEVFKIHRISQTNVEDRFANSFPSADDRINRIARRIAASKQGDSSMFARIRRQIVRPWIRGPHGVVTVLAAVVMLTSSSAFAQRGGAGCAGMSGGSSGAGGLGAAGGTNLAGGFGSAQSGFGNPAQMMIAAQQMQALQGQPGMGMVADSLGFDSDHRAYLAARKAFRAEQAAQREKRLATRPEKKTRLVAARGKSTGMR
jgi:hypothetical protein